MLKNFHIQDLVAFDDGPGMFAGFRARPARATCQHRYLGRVQSLVTRGVIWQEALLAHEAPEET